MEKIIFLGTPKWLDPLADRDKHSIEYALYPHAKDWYAAGTIYKACEYNHSLIARYLTQRGVRKPKGFVSVDAQ